MKEYKLSNTCTNPPTRAFQLLLTGVSDITDQPLKSQVDKICSCVSPRTMKVSEIGDFWAKRTMPSIRLQGKWMLRAGILPNRYVQISNPSPGILMISLLEEI